MARKALAQRNTTRTPHFLLNWRQEIACCIVAVAALLALFATLYAYGNKPSPDWPRWLSLNTIVSMYVVLLKSAVLLIAAEGLGQLKWTWFEESSQPLPDHATRGPAGSLALLWRLGIFTLSSCGALVIILALAVDPFAQQILRYYECSISVVGAAPNLPRTNWFTGEASVRSLQTP